MLTGYDLELVVSNPPVPTPLLYSRKNDNTKFKGLGKHETGFAFKIGLWRLER